MGHKAFSSYSEEDLSKAVKNMFKQMDWLEEVTVTVPDKPMAGVVVDKDDNFIEEYVTKITPQETIEVKSWFDKLKDKVYGK